MPYVDINRRFSKWRDESASDGDFDLFERNFSGGADWDELLKYQRVILLAEAGSGKSRELEECAKKLIDSGEFAFHATVQNVAKEGLAGALNANSRAKLEEWENSEATAWFFIDSVDEAKLDHIRFVDALRKIADGVGKALPRARIVISGRYTGWEFRADLQRLKEFLPIAQHTDTGHAGAGQDAHQDFAQRVSASTEASELRAAARGPHGTAGQGTGTAVCTGTGHSAARRVHERH